MTSVTTPCPTQNSSSFGIGPGIIVSVYISVAVIARKAVARRIIVSAFGCAAPAQPQCSCHVRRLRIHILGITEAVEYRLASIVGCTANARNAITRQRMAYHLPFEA